MKKLLIIVLTALFALFFLLNISLAQDSEVECYSDDDCTDNEFGLKCDTASSLCYCESDSDCLHGYYCSTAEGYCALAETSQFEAQTLTYQQIDPEIKQILNIPDDPSYSVILKQQISGMPSTFEEINPDYLPAEITEDDVLIAQEQVDVRTSMKFFTFTTPEKQVDLTLVKKEISTDLKDYVVIEQFPPELVSSSEEIGFIEEPEIISAYPVVVSFSASENAEIYYILKGNAIDYLTQIQTMVFPKEPIKIKGKSYEEPVCGDGVCTIPLEDEFVCPEDCREKLNWAYIIILLVILIIGIIGFYVWRKKRKSKPIKNPFKSAQDEAKLRNYIQSAIKSGKSKADIRAILVAKGWTDRQIDYIFQTINK